MAAIARAIGYSGPSCPRCGKPLEMATLRDGEEVCPNCNGFFEARTFQPPRRVIHVALVNAGPEAASPCANHPRNAAAASCQRCGVFICPLCELDVGGTHYCPSCFDRLTEEGTIATAQVRFRDFRSLSFISSCAGLILSFILGIPLGVLSIYYAIKALRDPNNEGSSRITPVISMLLGLADIVLGCLFLYGMFHTGK